MSNFNFLTTNWPELLSSAREAEQNVNSAPLTSRSLELSVKWLYANDSYLKKPYPDKLAALIHRLRYLTAPLSQMFCPTLHNKIRLCWYKKVVPQKSILC